MASQSSAVQEYSIRVPKNVKKSFKVMRFNSSVNVDFTKWTQAKMERENNMKEFRGMDDDTPKFGAGSEFGRDSREEARRRKYGINSKKYRPEDQPWILKVGGKTGKKFRGSREGGVAENAAYYVFTHARDGGIEAYPIQEWYNFQPTQRYKALSAEEAELEFGRRNKQVNYFSLMLRKRLRGDEDADPEEGEDGNKSKTKGKGKKGDLKISEIDDWIDSDDDKDSESGEEKESDEDEKEKEKKKKKEDPKKKKKKDPLDEAFEESDDGDEEGREVDYISDSSDSDSDHEGKVDKQLKGVAEEDALRKLLSSGEEDDEDEEKEREDGKESEGEDKQKTETPGGSKDEKEKKSKKKKHDKKKKDDGVTNDSSSGMSSDSSDSENDTKKKQNGSKFQKEPNSGASSRSVTPTKDTTVSESKRKATAAIEQMVNKKARLDNFAAASVAPVSIGNDSGITEDAVRRYLMRKPMTTTELLQKFKSKKTGLTSEQLVHIMTQILKRINPVKQTIKGKMYLSIKA